MALMKYTARRFLRVSSIHGGDLISSRDHLVHPPLHFNSVTSFVTAHHLSRNRQNEGTTILRLSRSSQSIYAKL